MNKRTVAGSWIVVGALCAGFAVSNSARGAESETITFESLLEEMVDRDRLSRLPSPAYTCRQFSSYDRNSTEPGSATWWANADRSHFVRIEDNNGRKEPTESDHPWRQSFSGEEPHVRTRLYSRRQTFKVD